MRQGYTRLGVLSGKFQNALSQLWRPLTRRPAAWSGTRSSDTGWVQPTYSQEDTIYGVLLEKSQASMFHTVGIAVKLDATLKTLDGVFQGDQIYDPQSNRTYAIMEEPVVTVDPDTHSFAFRTCHLRWLPYYRKGG
jgi:hypothetical protein